RADSAIFNNPTFILDTVYNKYTGKQKTATRAEFIRRERFGYTVCVREEAMSLSGNSDCRDADEITST
ncbi:hypothetical protein KR445_22855, partial [Escherichia coli]|uniref:hypothetical protein n=1 Tax=Escherichia coli TaxID=562 RepID=UPI001C38D847